MTNEQLF